MTCKTQCKETGSRFGPFVAARRFYELPHNSPRSQQDSLAAQFNRGPVSLAAMPDTFVRLAYAPSNEILSRACSAGITDESTRSWTD